MRATIAAWLLIIAGCATVPRKESVPLDAAAQRAAIAALDRFTVDGRVAATAGKEGSNATLNWEQRGDTTRLRLSGPLGAGAMHVVYSGTTLHMELAGGQVLDGEQAEAALRTQLGFAPPLAALRYWLRSLPAPGSPAMESRNEAGQLAWLEQDGWRVEYEEYRPQATPAGSVLLPRRLRASRESLRLRVVVDHWGVKP